jgi:hypothetical protein
MERDRRYDVAKFLDFLRDCPYAYSGDKDPESTLKMSGLRSDLAWIADEVTAGRIVLPDRSKIRKVA